VGFALELVQADAIARYRRLTGGHVRLQSGTDENALKNVLSARALGVPVRALVDENAARFAALAKALDISIDSFVRTTSERHATAVTALLSRLRTEDLCTRDYRGLYCVGCEEFYDARDLVDGRCPDHADPLTIVAEENVFFRLSNYATQLHERIACRELHIVPEEREREILRFIEGGLQDISISRDARRSEHWGIPFPGQPSQIVYVWIDALINYLSGLGFPDGPDVRRYWCDGNSCHVIGKNVWKFHAVYWPAILLGGPTASQANCRSWLSYRKWQEDQ
jgi:methionyl-tRNA synthetase